MTEEERLRRAKRQLIGVGVVCISLVVFVLWLTHLRANLVYLNKTVAPLPIQSLRSAASQLSPEWQELKNKLLKRDP